MTRSLLGHVMWVTTLAAAIPSWAGINITMQQPPTDYPLTEIAVDARPQRIGQSVWWGRQVPGQWNHWIILDFVGAENADDAEQWLNWPRGPGGIPYSCLQGPVRACWYWGAWTVPDLPTIQVTEHVITGTIPHPPWYNLEDGTPTEAPAEPTRAASQAPGETRYNGYAPAPMEED